MQLFNGPISYKKCFCQIISNAKFLCRGLTYNSSSLFCHRRPERIWKVKKNSILTKQFDKFCSQVIDVSRHDYTLEFLQPFFQSPILHHSHCMLLFVSKLKKHWTTPSVQFEEYMDFAFCWTFLPTKYVDLYMFQPNVALKNKSKITRYV